MGIVVEVRVEGGVDGVELRMAEKYLTKAEFSGVLERVEQHMVRIENKLDTLANRKCEK